MPLDLNQINKIRAHTFRGRWFRILWRRPKLAKDEVPGSNVGACDHPHYPKPNGHFIHIYPKQSTIKLFRTVLHESAHACLPDIDENTIEEFTCDFMRLVKRMNWEIKLK